MNRDLVLVRIRSIRAWRFCVGKNRVMKVTKQVGERVAFFNLTGTKNIRFAKSPTAFQPIHMEMSLSRAARDSTHLYSLIRTGREVLQRDMSRAFWILVEKINNLGVGLTFGHGGGLLLTNEKGDGGDCPKMKNDEDETVGCVPSVHANILLRERACVRDDL